MVSKPGLFSIAIDTNQFRLYFEPILIVFTRDTDAAERCGYA